MTLIEWAEYGIGGGQALDMRAAVCLTRIKFGYMA